MYWTPLKVARFHLTHVLIKRTENIQIPFMIYLNFEIQVYSYDAPSNGNEMKFALYPSQKEIHTVAARANAREPRFKVSFEGLSTEIDILIRSPIQVQTDRG